MNLITEPQMPVPGSRRGSATASSLFKIIGAPSAGLVLAARLHKSGRIRRVCIFHLIQLEGHWVAFHGAFRSPRIYGTRAHRGEVFSSLLRSRQIFASLQSAG